VPIMYGAVGAPSNTSAADGTNNPFLQGKQSELVDVNLHGKYYTQAYRSNSYIGSTGGAGVVPPIYTTTAQTFGIWNVAGNTRNAALQTLDVGIVTAGTVVVSSFCLGQSLNAGSALATGGISVFTAGTPQGGNIGISGGNTVRFTPSAATTLAATFLMALNYGFYSTAVTAASPAQSLHYDFEGGVIVPPNAAVWVSNNVASSYTFIETLRWEEPPV
jgi:hypothetical protein